MNPKKKVRVNLPNPAQMSFMKEAGIDFGNLCAKLDTNMKLTDWENFGGQALRASLAAKLGNDGSVSVTEAMAALRHRSVSAHKHCNRTSGISETNRFKALGIIKK